MRENGTTLEVTCQYCGEDIRFIDGEWLDRETHSTCDRLDLPDRKHGPINQSEQGDIVAAITAIVRDADQTFQKVGGTSRHWVRDCFLPLLNRRGWYLCPTTPTEEPPSTNAADRGSE